MSASVYFSEEQVPVIPVIGKFVGINSVHRPPQATLENSKYSLEMVFGHPYQIRKLDNSLAVISALPSTYPCVAIESSHLEIGAPFKSKTPYYNSQICTAFRSGTRSCVMRCCTGKESSSWKLCYLNDGSFLTPDLNGDRYIRLKGCGMWTQEDQGSFPFITLKKTKAFPPQPADPPLFEVRGVSYPTTSATELYATSEINNFLRRLDMIGGNTPLGFWIYREIPNDPAPLVEKAVTILECVSASDKRFQNHLQSGLERFITAHISQDAATRILAVVEGVYKQQNVPMPSSENNTIRRSFSQPFDLKGLLSYLAEVKNSAASVQSPFFTAEKLKSLGFLTADRVIAAVDALPPIALSVLSSSPSLSSSSSDSSVSSSSYCCPSFSSCSSSSSSSSSCSSSFLSSVSFAPGYSSSSSSPSASSSSSSSSSSSIPSVSSSPLASSPSESASSLDIGTFFRLFARLGFEAGACTAAVHRSGFMWGSYTDRLDRAAHCNAHGDNLVVLGSPLIRTHSQFLAPIDFDMAMRPETSINLFKDPPVPDPNVSNGSFFTEYTTMLHHLDGLHATFAGTNNFVKTRAPLEGRLDDLVWVLRDVMCAEYFEGYQKPTERNVAHRRVDLDKAIAIIEASLYLSREVNA